MEKIPKVCVLGAGVVGLSTAVCLQEMIPGCHVTVMADKMNTETTSHGAGGIFRPTLKKTPGVPLSLLKCWLLESWQYLHKLAMSEEGPGAGVTFVSGYQFLTKPSQVPLHADINFHFRQLDEKELQMFPQHFKYGWYFTTLVCECSKYLPFLTKRLKEKGGTFIRREVTSLQELEGHYDVVMNCSGLGSQKLLGDDKLVPIRGHVIRVQAPWIKHFVYLDENCFIIPGADTVVVGCTRQTGDYEVNIRQEDHKQVWQQATSLMPSLKRAKILWDWVGLRPYREPLRLEPELLTCSNGKLLKVVHNYGHGAEGVSLAWGTAKHAVKLCQGLLRSTASKL